LAHPWEHLHNVGSYAIFVIDSRARTHRRRQTVEREQGLIFRAYRYGRARRKTLKTV